MNMEFDNSNRGALFLNDRKTSDNHPDWKGRINIAGVDHWLSGWKKQTAKGPVLSLSLGDPCERQAPPQEAPPVRTAPRATTSKYPPSESQGHADSDIPW